MNGTKGFTLLELLLAIAIFALVAAVGYGAYYSTLGNLSRVGEESEAAERSAAILGRLSEELSSLVFVGEVYFIGENLSYPGGRRDSLLFLGNSPLLLDREARSRGPVLIGYLTEPEGDSGLLTLYRTESEVLPGVALEQGVTRKDLLARGVMELRFSYLRDDGAIVSDWQKRGGDEEKQEPAGLPRAVTAELVFPPTSPGREVRRFAMLALLPDGQVR